MKLDQWRLWKASMAFDRASDIVMDVMKAANPDKVAAVVKRLQTIEGAAAEPFDSHISASRHVGSAPVAARQSSSATAMGAPGGIDKAAVEFEALIMGTFVSQMMPKSGGGMFDHGAGGDMWRSFLSEQIGRQIAKSGRVSIGKHLFATHPLPSSSQSQLQSSPATDARSLGS